MKDGDDKRVDEEERKLSNFHWMEQGKGRKDWMDGEGRRLEMMEGWRKKNEDWRDWMDRDE